MNTIGICRAAALFLFGCASASAQVVLQVQHVPYVPYAAPELVAQAHQHLADTFNRQAVTYAVWYGLRQGQYHRGLHASYSGSGCASELRSATSGGQFGVDWSAISAVEHSGPEGLYVVGHLLRPVHAEGNRHYVNFHLVFPDRRHARSAMNALELLRRSCDRRSSRFD